MPRKAAACRAAPVRGTGQAPPSQQELPAAGLRTAAALLMGALWALQARRRAAESQRVQSVEAPAVLPVVERPPVPDWRPAVLSAARWALPRSPAASASSSATGAAAAGPAHPVPE
ncbi:MAG: hypothetical protein IKE60_21010 [Reyranella sp.]|uniref:hypothetical protein n=1 Tax=Reyranella sp. TaxID=1929291 RepID=UPI0025EEB144|nr:hypothetical protein [Reyranella sp.]MBR2817151.1 hypothetical protein [Reyranella sp.]